MLNQSDERVATCSQCLQEFPDLAMARSVDHRLPLHMAAAHPSPEGLCCILDHDYPDNLMQTFLHASSGATYRAG